MLYIIMYMNEYVRKIIKNFNQIFNYLDARLEPSKR